MEEYFKLSEYALYEKLIYKMDYGTLIKIIIMLAVFVHKKFMELM